MTRKKSDIAKDGYTAKQGGHGKGHKSSGGQRGTSIGAARQQAGLPYFPAPPRGFRPGPPNGG